MKRLLPILFIVLFMLTGCTEKPKAPAEPVSGEYRVLGVDGERTFPEWTALKFDFENEKFNFGAPVVTNDWIREGDLTVEGNRVTAVSNKPKSVMEGDQLKILGYITWVFEFQDDGTIRFIPEDSDEYTIYGTELNAESVLVRVADLAKPIE